MDRDCVVGIVTTLRAGRSGDRIPVTVRFSATVQTGPGAHPGSCTMGTKSLSLGVRRPVCGVYHPPHLAPGLKKEYSCTSSTPLWPFMVCTRVNFTFFTRKITRGFEFPLAPLYAVVLFADGEVAAARLPVTTKTSVVLQLWPLLSYEH